MQYTKEVQTRKNENIIETDVPEEMYGKYLVEGLSRKWSERFLDEDTGEVTEVERFEPIYDRGTYLQEDQIAVIQFHIQAGDVEKVKVSDQRRTAVLAQGWSLVPWSVTAHIFSKNYTFILLARNIFQALEIVTDYIELHYDKSFSIGSARGFKHHIFLQDDTARLVENEAGTEVSEKETDEAQKDVYVFYSASATVKFGGKLSQDSTERDYMFLVYAKSVEDVKSRIEKYITGEIRSNAKYNELGMFEQLFAENDFEVSLKTATTVNCSAVICREFSLAYNPDFEQRNSDEDKANTEGGEEHDSNEPEKTE